MVFAATESPLPKSYWHLHRLGYIFVARNYTPARAKGAIDLVSFDKDALVFVEARTRAQEEGKNASPSKALHPKAPCTRAHRAFISYVNGTTGIAHCELTVW